MLAKILLIKKNRLSLHRLRATIELWCNGNTADFGSVILSSNLGSSTTRKLTHSVSFFCISCDKGASATFQSKPPMGRTSSTTHRWLFHVKATSATLLTRNISRDKSPKGPKGPKSRKYNPLRPFCPFITLSAL